MSATTYTLRELADIAGAELLLNAPDRDGFTELLTDSRKLVHPEETVFFALSGERHDGHRFIHELSGQGVKNFVVSRLTDALRDLPANFALVPDTLVALQKLASFHRKRFNIPVIGITGSNGKTIVKEWLYQLLRTDKNIVRSPKSYN